MHPGSWIMGRHRPRRRRRHHHHRPGGHWESGQTHGLAVSVVIFLIVVVMITCDSHSSSAIWMSPEISFRSWPSPSFIAPVNSDGARSSCPWFRQNRPSARFHKPVSAVLTAKNPSLRSEGLLPWPRSGRPGRLKKWNQNLWRSNSMSCRLAGSMSTLQLLLA